MSELNLPKDTKMDGWFTAGASAVVMSSPSSSSSGRTPDRTEHQLDAKEEDGQPKNNKDIPQEGGTRNSKSISRSPQRHSRSSTRELQESNSRSSQPREKTKDDKDQRRQRSQSSSSGEGRRKKTEGDKSNADSRDRRSADRKRHRDSPERRQRPRRSRSRSPERRRRRSPFRERRRGPERYRDWRRRSRSPKRRSRSRNRRSKSRERRSRSREQKNRSRDRHSRSRSHEKRQYRRRRTPSRDRYRRKKSRSLSRSRSKTPPTNKDKSKSQTGTTDTKVGSLNLTTMTGAITPQMALQQTMAAMSAKAQALTGIELPKYYNPAAVNPLKYAEQVQKRKMLWQTTEKEKEEQPKGSVWDKMKFASDDDGKVTAKFRKLMGMRHNAEGSSEGGEQLAIETLPEPGSLQQQEELFRNLDQQYEMARMSTHTHRGVGLGYSSQAPVFPPLQKP